MKRNTHTALLGATLVLSPFIGVHAASLAYIGVDSSNQSSIQLNTGADANVDTSVNAGAGADASTDNSESTVDSERTNVSLESDINVVRNAEFEAETQNSVMVNANSVSSENDLRVFAEGQLRSNADLDSVHFTSEAVEVTYKDQGRFIGVIPVTLSVDVTVDQDGSIEVDYPWYGFLVLKDKGDLEAEIQAAVNATISAEATGNWTNNERAVLADRIVSALKAHYDAKVEVEATATGTATVE